jgi:hypothetical protein
MWGEGELFSEGVGEENKKGKSQPFCAENENAGTNSEPEELKVTKLTDRRK